MSPASLPELHLPDLPEVHLGGTPDAAPRRAPGWRQALRQLFANYLPLLMMALVALGTGWLVKNTPQPPGERAAAPPRQLPDYTMRGFAITRFDPSGRVAVRISGDVMRHYPATDRLEIEGVRIQAIAPDGRTTDASAMRALANGDASEVQLIGDARVLAQLEGGQTLAVRGEFLHAFLRFEQLRSHLPVQVTRGRTDVHAAGMDYDHVLRTLQLAGPVRMRVAPGPTAVVSSPLPSGTP